MLTGTSELAIRALVYLSLRGEREPVPPKKMVESLLCSPTYLGKTLGLLVKADILRSVRGARGGVILSYEPEQITLLAIVEACQGTILGDYCGEVSSRRLKTTCKYHQVMTQLHEATIEILSGCTLAQLAACPAPKGPLSGKTECKVRILPPSQG